MPTTTVVSRAKAYLKARQKSVRDAMKDLKDAKPPELVPLDNVMTKIRRVKDDNEIDLIRKSVGVAEEAYDAVRGGIEVGMTENDLAGEMIFELRSRGASDSSFPVIV